MKVAVTHSNLDITRLFRYILSEIGHEVIWTALDGKTALRKAEENPADLIIMKLSLSDISTPELIKQILDKKQTTIIMVGKSIKKQPSKVFEAMSAGALDAFSEPSTDEPESIKDIKRKIKNISLLHDSISSNKKTKPVGIKDNLPLVAIGSSTGGPAALIKVLNKIKPDTKATFVVIQHMDKQFSHGMVKWIDEQTDIKVEIAKIDQKPVAGIVYCAGTNDHLIIKKNGHFDYTENPVDYPYRPSVDAFFESAITHWPNKMIGVLLTGMGRDGASGLLSFYNRDMFTIAQNEESCAVYGMPKAAIELNAAKKILHIDDIGDAINKALKTII
jgi:two-component system, chemotaxis family, response regulator WspF